MRQTTNTRTYVLVPLTFFYEHISDPAFAKSVIDTADHWDQNTDLLYFREHHPLASYFILKDYDTVQLAQVKGWENW